MFVFIKKYICFIFFEQNTFVTKTWESQNMHIFRQMSIFSNDHGTSQKIKNDIYLSVNVHILRSPSFYNKFHPAKQR